MDWFNLLLRDVHILGAVAWLGGAALYVVVVEGLARRLPPDEAARLVRDIQLRSHASKYFPAAGMLTVLPGIILYFTLKANAAHPWTTIQGITFQLGAISGIVAIALGIASGVKGYKVLEALAKEYAAKPTPDLRDRLLAQSRHLDRWNHIEIGFMLVALLGMASFRYLP